MFIEDGGARLLRDRTRKLLVNMPGALAGQVEPIHQIRVASRRLRVMLPILAANPEGRRVRRLRSRLKEIVTIPGASRDLDICVTLFDDHLCREASIQPEVAALRRRLLAARARSRRLMKLRLTGLEVGRIRRGLNDLLRRGPEDLFVTLARYRRVLNERTTHLLEAMEANGDRYDPAGLHDVRKLARRLRYVAEVGAAFREDVAGAAERFRKIQDELGRVQDAHVLASRLEMHAAMAARRGHREMAARAREIAGGYSDLSRSLHHGYLLMNPAEEVRAALRILDPRRLTA